MTTGVALFLLLIITILAASYFLEWVTSRDTDSRYW